MKLTVKPFFTDLSCFKVGTVLSEFFLCEKKRDSVCIYNLVLQHETNVIIPLLIMVLKYFYWWH